VAAAVGKLISTAAGYVRDSATPSPDWPHDKRTHHWNTAWALFKSAEDTLGPFGGREADALRAKVVTTREELRRVEDSYRKDVGKVPGRSRAIAAYLQAVRDLAAAPLRGTLSSLETSTVIAVHSALQSIVWGLDDVDRCTLAGKPCGLSRGYSAFTIVTTGETST
jgi:hypothetical protein